MCVPLAVCETCTYGELGLHSSCFSEKEMHTEICELFLGHLEVRLACREGMYRWPKQVCLGGNKSLVVRGKLTLYGLD